MEQLACLVEEVKQTKSNVASKDTRPGCSERGLAGPSWQRVVKMLSISGENESPVIFYHFIRMRFLFLLACRGTPAVIFTWNSSRDSVFRSQTSNGTVCEAKTCCDVRFRPKARVR